MAATMIRTLDYGKGYTGKSANRCWIARITGSDKQYGLTREFLDPVNVERDHFNRARTMVHFSYELEEDGLYELSAEGDRWFVFVFKKDNGELKSAKLSDERLRAWVSSLDEGKTDLEARLASRGL